MCVERRASFSPSSQPRWRKLQRWRLHHSLEIAAERRQVCNDEIIIRLWLDYVNCMDGAQWHTVVVFMRGYLINNTEKFITGWFTGRPTKLSFRPVCRLTLTELEICNRLINFIYFKMALLAWSDVHIINVWMISAFCGLELCNISFRSHNFFTSLLSLSSYKFTVVLFTWSSAALCTVL